MRGLRIKVRLRLSNNDLQPAAQSHPWQLLPKTLKEVNVEDSSFPQETRRGSTALFLALVSSGPMRETQAAASPLILGNCSGTASFSSCHLFCWTWLLWEVGMAGASHQNASVSCAKLPGKLCSLAPESSA